MSTITLDRGPHLEKQIHLFCLLQWNLCTVHAWLLFAHNHLSNPSMKHPLPNGDRHVFQTNIHTCTGIPIWYMYYVCLPNQIMTWIKGKYLSQCSTSGQKPASTLTKLGPALFHSCMLPSIIAPAISLPSLVKVHVVTAVFLPTNEYSERAAAGI